MRCAFDSVFKRGSTCGNVLPLVLLCAFSASTGAWGEDPWADAVAAHHAIDPNPGFNAPEKALSEPTGGGAYAADNSGVHSIGIAGSYIVLKFNTAVTNDPNNFMGLDCIVYGNAFWTGGNPQRRWAEPGLIEISEDVNSDGVPNDPWYVIPGSRALPQSVAATGIPNPTPPLVAAGGVLNPNSTDANPNNDLVEFDWGYADSTPTQKKYLDNYVRPDNPFEVGLTPRSGGGDAFDIAWAVDGSGQPANLARFHFIRIWTLVQGSVAGAITTEIDAVADVAPQIDVDGDGILDEYEMRVAGTDPARAESTVLALEIPPQDGGSPAGTLLGTAADSDGNAIRLYSSGTRSGARNYNCVVDILRPEVPGGSIPGLLISGAVRDFQSSENDFLAAKIQDAEFTIAYRGAEIAGLDEVGLQPYRYSADGYTQAGISSVTRDTAANMIVFRSRYPGLFVLASVAGSGNIDTGTGTVILNATPPDGVVADPVNTVQVTSDPILLADDTPAPEGTLFTVATTLGSIPTPDADAGTPGTQVAVIGQAIGFSVVPGTQAGRARFSAISLDGTTSGTLDYDFLPGPPAGPVAILLYTPNATAPGPLTFITDVLVDAHGNPIADGTLLTLVAEGGVISSWDADPAAPGHQVRVANGLTSFMVLVDIPEEDPLATVTILLYADAGLAEQIGEETFVLEIGEPIRMPVGGIWTLWLVPALMVLGWRRIR